MILKPFQKRTWAEIDLNSVAHNFKEIRNSLNPHTKLCCVVKANGYGHGAVMLSKAYEDLGADYLAVSNIEEAFQLRNSGIMLPILILGYTNPECAAELSDKNITQCVFSYDYGKALSKYAVDYGKNIKIHIKLDTGMGRIGFRCNSSELDNVIDVCKLPGLAVEGVFTHFSAADEGDHGREYTLSQFEKFMNAIAYCEDNNIHFVIRHCANSAGIFDYPNMQLDMVRAGVVLYGLQPSEDLKNPGSIKPILALKTIVDCVKDVYPGDCISYGREFKVEHNMKVATIPIGYADGLFRSNFHNHMFVEVEGNLAPIVGRVCMDQCMIDVTDIPNVRVDSEVIVYGLSGNTSVDHIANINKTINYEIVCALGERVPRVYIKDGQIVSIMDNMI